MTTNVGQVDGQTNAAPMPIPSVSVSSPLATRMSILAVTAFVVGLLACLTCFAGYVFGVIGNVLAISALILIRREQGRLRGRSLAVAAIALNSIAFLFGVVFTAGAAQVAKSVVKYVAPVQDIQNKNLDKARGAFAKSIAAEVTSERLATFDARVKEQLGTFTSVPTKDLIEFLRRAMDGIRDQSAALSKVPMEPQIVPWTVPTDFEKGRALLIVCLDPNDKTPEFSLGRIRNLGVLKDGSGEIIWLLPLKDNTPAGLAQPLKQNTAKATQPDNVARETFEAPPPPVAPQTVAPEYVLPPS